MENETTEKEMMELLYDKVMDFNDGYDYSYRELDEKIDNSNTYLNSNNWWYLKLKNGQEFRINITEVTYECKPKPV